MNEEQQIKEMAINLCGRKDFSNMCPYSGEECDYSCTYIDDADNLVCAGYGNVNEAVKEFAEFIIAQMTDKCHRGCPYKQGTFTDVDMHRLMNEFFEKENRNAD